MGMVRTDRQTRKLKQDFMSSTGQTREDWKCFSPLCFSCSWSGSGGKGVWKKNQRLTMRNGRYIDVLNDLFPLMFLPSENINKEGM